MNVLVKLFKNSEFKNRIFFMKFGFPKHLKNQTFAMNFNILKIQKNKKKTGLRSEGQAMDDSGQSGDFIH